MTTLEKILLFSRHFFFLRIALKNHLLNAVSGLRLDRMCNIAVFAIRCLFARHRNKQTLLAIHNFDIMQNKLIINRDRNDRLHLIAAFQSTDSDIRNLHLF